MSNNRWLSGSIAAQKIYCHLLHFDVCISLLRVAETCLLIQSAIAMLSFTNLNQIQHAVIIVDGKLSEKQF